MSGHKRASSGKVKRQVRRAMRKGYDFSVDRSTGEVTRVGTPQQDVKLDKLGLGSTGKARRERARQVSSAYESGSSINVNPSASSDKTIQAHGGLFPGTTTRKSSSVDEGVSSLNLLKGGLKTSPGAMAHLTGHSGGSALYTTGHLSPEQPHVHDGGKVITKGEWEDYGSPRVTTSKIAGGTETKTERDQRRRVDTRRLSELTPDELAYRQRMIDENPDLYDKMRYEMRTLSDSQRSLNPLKPTTSLSSAGIQPYEMPEIKGGDLDIPRINPNTGSITGGTIYKTRDTDRDRSFNLPKINLPKINLPKVDLSGVPDFFENIGEGIGEGVRTVGEGIGRGASAVGGAVGDAAEAVEDFLTRTPEEKAARVRKQQNRRADQGKCPPPPPCPPCNN